MHKKGFVFLLLFINTIVFSQKKIIEELIIRGAKKTKPTTLRKSIISKNGKVLDSIVLKNDIIRLKRMPAIAHAYFQVFHSHENKYKVYVNIEENFTILPELNFWTTTNKRFAYKVGLNDYNFLGKNIAFGGFYQNNTFDSYGISFRTPTLFSRQWGLALHHQNWISEEPLYFNNETANYKYQNISWEVLALYQINFKHQLQFGLNFFKEKYNYLTGAISNEVPRSLDVNKQLFKLVYTYDDLDYYYQYINGFKSQFYGQYVTSKNEYQDDFIIFWNDFFYYKRIGDKGNWANRLRIGLSSNNNTPFAPFDLDNNVNLRGVGILVDRGTGSVVWNTEYRHTLYKNNWFALQGNTFTDFGTWRNPGGSFNDFITMNNIRIYSGIGLRFINKKIFNAVFRIDYGYGLTNNGSKGIVFGLGQYF